MKTQLVAKAIVINDSGEMLMVRRSKTDSRRPLQWDLPGGMVEEGEDIAIATARETEEETGIKLDPAHLDLVYSHTAVKHALNVVWMFYVGKTAITNVSLSYEHDKCQWLSLKDATTQFEYPLQRDVLKYLSDYKVIQDLPL